MKIKQKKLGDKIMLENFPNKTEKELEALNKAIVDAISKVREGIYVSINHLENWCEKICQSIIELPSQNSKKIAYKLDLIIKDLDILKELVMKQLTAMKYQNLQTKKL